MSSRIVPGCTSNEFAQYQASGPDGRYAENPECIEPQTYAANTIASTPELVPPELIDRCNRMPMDPLSALLLLRHPQEIVDSYDACQDLGQALAWSIPAGTLRSSSSSFICSRSISCHDGQRWKTSREGDRPSERMIWRYRTGRSRRPHHSKPLPCNTRRAMITRMISLVPSRI